MDSGEFWLPSDFLSEDLGSGVGSNLSWTEAESDEDDYIAGLTRQMARSFLIDENPKPSLLATSPQSTLCGMGSWSFSSNGSPDGPSQVSSPPSTPFPQQPSDEALDLLYAAAGQVVRLGLNDDSFGGRGLLGLPQKPKPTTKNHRMSQALIQQQLKAAQFYQLKRQQLLKQQQHSAAAWARQIRSDGGTNEVYGVRPLGSSNSAWPPLQKQHHQRQLGSGMRAVFLNGARRESTGTGVFLPRRVGTPNEPRKKAACSTVLLPARVVQALNLNLDDMGVHPRVSAANISAQEAFMARGNTVQMHQKLNPQPAVSTSHDIRLPTEWTY